MKGVIFTELLDMVEGMMGLEMVEQIIEEADLESEGAYTNVGTYPSAEIESILVRLGHHTKLSRGDLLETFGKHLFGRLAAHYPYFFPAGVDFFQFMSSIHDYIHVEVKKLYPDAELPDLKVLDKGPDHMVLLYESSRKMWRLARGLTQGCMEHFELEGSIEERIVKEDGSQVEFIIKKRV